MSTSSSSSSRSTSISTSAASSATWRSPGRAAHNRVVVLSKADLIDDPVVPSAEVERIAIGAPILTVSAIDGRGLDEVRARIGTGRTVAFVGSSGVGKSTLLNALAGEDRALVREVRDDDDRGRHTTTRRQLHILPDGGLILDTPGMRELALWDSDGVDHSFRSEERRVGR